MDEIVSYVRDRYDPSWRGVVVLPISLYFEWEGLSHEEKKETVRELNRLRLGAAFDVSRVTYAAPNADEMARRDMQRYYDKLLDLFFQEMRKAFWNVSDKLDSDHKEMLREHLYHVVDTILDRPELRMAGGASHDKTEG